MRRARAGRRLGMEPLALEDELLERSSRIGGAALPTLAVAAAAVAFLSLPAAPPDREQTARTPKSALEQPYAIFRRPQTARRAAARAQTTSPRSGRRPPLAPPRGRAQRTIIVSLELTLRQRASLSRGRMVRGKMTV